MLSLANSPSRQLLFGLSAGVLVMALLVLASSALAQVATVTPGFDVAQMIALCRQMMSQAGSMMQAMMSGMCMMGR